MKNMYDRLVNDGKIHIHTLTRPNTHAPACQHACTLTRLLDQNTLGLNVNLTATKILACACLHARTMSAFKARLLYVYWLFQTSLKLAWSKSKGDLNVNL